MECLRGYISLYGVGLTAPDSGLYVNQLPGITIESIDKLAKPEQVTYIKAWEDIETRSLKKFESNVTAAFAKRYRKKTLKQSVNIGKIVNLLTNQSTAVNQFRGFAAESNYPNLEPYTVSNLLGTYWQTLPLYLKNIPAAPIVLKICDLDTLETLWTKTVNNAANPVTLGWNDISVNQIFYSSFRFFAAYDAAQVDSPELKLNSNLSSSYIGCIRSICGSSCNAYIRGVETTTKTLLTDLTYSDNSFGLSGVFSVICSFYPLICNNKRIFADALWYQHGEELLTDRLYSGRWNWWTLDIEQNKEMINYFKGVRTREIEKAIDGIDLDLSDACLECNQRIQIMEALP